jgi:hypothetical protein
MHKKQGKNKIKNRQKTIRPKMPKSKDKRTISAKK